jgi:serralysin
MSTNSDLHHFCMDILPTVDRDGTKAAVLAKYRWPQGQRITVRFLEGDPALHERVKAVAREWVRPELARLYLDFRPTTEKRTDIRIAFQAGNGSWSVIGTFCRQIPEPEPTMNFGWIDAQSPDSVLRPVVLHEFGHALGLIHEHQSPKGGIHWNKDAVIKDLSGPPNNWDLPTIEHNMFERYSPDAVIATPVDPKSIMMYPIPAAWTTDDFSAGFNLELSAMDRTLVHSVYT